MKLKDIKPIIPEYQSILLEVHEIEMVDLYADEIHYKSCPHDFTSTTYIAFPEDFDKRHSDYDVISITPEEFKFDEWDIYEPIDLVLRIKIKEPLKEEKDD